MILGLSLAIAAALYGSVCTLTGLSFWLMRWYASLRGRLMNRDVPDSVLRRRIRISMLSPILYAAATVCSLRFPLPALVIYAAIRVYFAIANLGSSRAGAE